LGVIVYQADALNGIYLAIDDVPGEGINFENFIARLQFYDVLINCGLKVAYPPADRRAATQSHA
jgi:hypothetical protein